MVNILISVDDHYLDKARTMLFSFRMHMDEEADVYLLNHSISEESIAQFGAYLSEKCRMGLHVIDFRKTALDDMPYGSIGFSIETYYRVIAQYYLPPALERILWLDADMIVRADLSQFYYQDFEGKCYVVCPDVHDKHVSLYGVKAKVGIPQESVYFNAGVLLFNLPVLREKYSQQEVIEACVSKQDQLTYYDQDILNYLYAGQVKYAEWEKYNYQLNIESSIPAQGPEGSYILHYAGPSKPWNYWQINSNSRYWWEVRCKQGYRWDRIKAYTLKTLDLTKWYFRKIKSILF